MADLSGCDRETTERLVVVDEFCGTLGVGDIYGQLVILGYKVRKAAFIIRQIALFYVFVCLIV